MTATSLNKLNAAVGTFLLVVICVSIIWGLLAPPEKPKDLGTKDDYNDDDIGYR